jgi:hypothetical protein
LRRAMAGPWGRFCVTVRRDNQGDTRSQGPAVCSFYCGWAPVEELNPNSGTVE